MNSICRRDTGSPQLITEKMLSPAKVSQNDENFTTRYSNTLTCRLTWELPVKVTRGCAVSYRFTTSPADISFGLMFCDLAGVESTLKEVDRVPSHIGAANGTIHPACEGTIYFRWDNSYSWLTAKELTYLIEVSGPTVPAAGEDLVGGGVAGLVVEMTLKREIKALQEQVSELEIESAKAKEDMRNTLQKLDAALAEKNTLEGELGGIKTLLENVQAHRKESETRHSAFIAAQNARYESEISVLKAAEQDFKQKKLTQDKESDKVRDTLKKCESELRDLRAGHENELKGIREKKGERLQAALADKARLEQELASLKATSMDLQAQHEALSRLQKEAQVSRDEARAASDKLQALAEEKARLEKAFANTSATQLQAGGDALKKVEHEVQALRAANQSLTANEQELRVQRAANDALRTEVASLKAANDSLVTIQNHMVKKKKEEEDAASADDENSPQLLEVTNVLITAPDIPVLLETPSPSLLSAPPTDVPPLDAPESPQGKGEIPSSPPSSPVPAEKQAATGDMNPLLVPINAGLFMLTLGQVNAWTAEGAVPESGQGQAEETAANPQSQGAHGDRELNALKSSKPMRASMHQAQLTPDLDAAPPAVGPPPQLPLRGILKKQPPESPSPRESDNSQQQKSGDWGWLGKL